MEKNQFKVKFIGSTMLTPTVAQLNFRRCDEQPFAFIPGQFITFLLPHESGKIVSRHYSLANSPGEILEIAIAPVEGGFATKILFDLKMGDELDCVGPKGRLILQPTERPRHYLLVATGTGVAPYRSMLPTIAERLEEDPKLRVTLLLGVRYAHDLLYAEDFTAFAKQYPNFDFRSYLSRPEKAPDHHLGYVQSAFETLDLNPMADLVYLCGNPFMIEHSMAKLQKLGFKPSSIRSEKYISRGV